MKAKGIFISIILVFTACGAIAQKLGMTDRLGGTYVVSFKTPEGEIKVFLPDDMSGGDTVSAAVFAYPDAGKDTLLKSYKIHTDYQSAPVSSGRITLNVPRNMSGSSLRVTLRDADNREISYSTAAVKLPDTLAERPENPTPFDFETPLVGQSGRLAEIRGPFDGDFATTGLSIGGRPAHVVSESPRKLVFEVPADIPGQAEIVLSESGVTTKRPFTALRVVKIGDESAGASSGVVPEGYTAGASQSTIAVEENITAEVVEKEPTADVPSSEPGLIEEELQVETIAPGETVSETHSDPGSISSNAGVAVILQAQLNLPLEGAAKLVKSEEIDTVVVRELDITEETETRGQAEVKVLEKEELEEEIIEEEIVMPERKEAPSAPGPAADDASYSSRDLIERIYESTQEGWKKTPPEVSERGKADIKKSPPDKSSYGEKGKYTVQVASFRDPNAANRYARKLERKGYRVRVTQADVPGKGRWSRVSVGSFDTKEQAKAYGERLKRQEPGIKSVYVTRIN